ncbi:acyl-coenzyme A thioesterase PaaI-like protein [Rhodococcus opacus]|nr:acyl-coenzyme A thioesterase PaaI-like protein [Rhodococcus opacus]
MTSQVLGNGARVRTATALRNLGHRLVEHDIDEALLERIAALADELAESVIRFPSVRRTVGDLLEELSCPPPCDGEAMDHYPSCPVSGQENPLGLAVTVRRDGDDVVATAVFDAGCAGMPGVTHGGPVAAVFDDVMGFVLSTLNGLSGFTASMTVSYRAPVRIGVEVEFRGRLDRREGRKLFIEAAAHDKASGRLLAEAQGLFIEVPVEALESVDR